jgi:hypothetical protein
MNSEFLRKRLYADREKHYMLNKPIGGRNPVRYIDGELVEERDIDPDELELEFEDLEDVPEWHQPRFDERMGMGIRMGRNGHGIRKFKGGLTKPKAPYNVGAVIFDRHHWTLGQADRFLQQIPNINTPLLAIDDENPAVFVYRFQRDPHARGRQENIQHETWIEVIEYR